MSRRKSEFIKQLRGFSKVILGSGQSLNKLSSESSVRLFHVEGLSKRLSERQCLVVVTKIVEKHFSLGFLKANESQDVGVVGNKDRGKLIANVNMDSDNCIQSNIFT